MATIVSREPLDPKEAKWTKLVKVSYRDPDGVLRLWESAERTTRPATSDVDGVDIVALLTDDDDDDNNNEPTEPEIILLKQFRPAVGNTVIEVPAGLVDAGESPETAAVRELREETGYHGVVVSDATSSPLILFSDPGFSNNNLRIVELRVDRNLPENKDPKPALEDGELVEAVFTVPLSQLAAVCRRLAEQEGYAIDARVGTLAAGLEMAKRFTNCAK